MHVIVSALGSAGDVHPFMVIGAALVELGHSVTLLAAPPFEQRIRRAGLRFAPLGRPGDFERLVQRADVWDPRRGTMLLLDELLDHLPDAYATTAGLVEEAIAGEVSGASGAGVDLPDDAAGAVAGVRPRRGRRVEGVADHGSGGVVLVGSTLSWNMRLVQETHGLPGATVHLAPVCIASADEPPVLAGIGDVSWMPSWALRGLQTAAERLVVDRLVGPRLNRLRAELGLPPVRHIVSRWMHSPDLVVGAWPAWFAPAQSDWPPQASTSGFPVFAESGAPLDDALAAFLDRGAPPIGVTPGSAMAHGRTFFEKAMAASQAVGRRAVLVTPYREQLPAVLPPWAHHVAYAPFSRLLPRLSAFVHHGGIGTSAQALDAGVAQLVCPFAHDQFDNAARLVRLGVARGVRIEDPSSLWTDALRSLLADEASDASPRDPTRDTQAYDALSNDDVRAAGVGGTARAVAFNRERMSSAEPAGPMIAMRLQALGAPGRARTLTTGPRCSPGSRGAR